MTYGKRLRSRVRPRPILRRLVHEACKASAPVVCRLTPLRNASFKVGDQHLPYFVHPYNTTWRNERAVEVPLALDFIERQKTSNGLEFGNVLTHYGRPIDLKTVDKYERGPGVENCDIVEFAPSDRFDFIVSISTIEHVGWDEPTRDASKLDEAFLHLRNLLAPGGRLFLTAALGYNPHLDKAVLERSWPTLWQTTLVREQGRWRERPDLQWRPYSYWRGARSVWVAEVDSACDRE